MIDLSEGKAHDRPMNHTDLSAEMRRRDAAWDSATAEVREQTRADYRSAGWKTCAHADCPPWDCRITNPR